MSRWITRPAAAALIEPSDRLLEHLIEQVAATAACAQPPAGCLLYP